ncbi:MAG: hypothetical protein Q8P68_02790 [Candidatus Peregrinibacteria bacterium]|nr:hypothetical protein [Candidatus Peregrinibacteria bacterium]MDZ4245034.1 hypothetical protein [Candidatus Gracilibacteria bacterium]
MEKGELVGVRGGGEMVEKGKLVGRVSWLEKVSLGRGESKGKGALKGKGEAKGMSLFRNLCGVELEYEIEKASSHSV